MNRNIFFSVIAGLMVFSGQTLAADRLELDNTAIIGSRELPKVLYIVPWKKSRIGTLAGVSEKGSFKESMTALDRDVFLRELDYYRVLNESNAVSR
ncbi:MAG: hypothetical protein AMJ55_02205 [Gammaproteobacteria bacterium SG8_15]|jgi:hypothetical protein|nr:MAG: hypothetical protein AMJ55_02205 [Gammaproteobacteria bacterium SG8_15]